MPARPTKSLLTRFPTAQAAGVFGFYCDTFSPGQVERRQSACQPDDLDGYYRLVAQRQGGRLAVSFTDADEHPRSAPEAARCQLRASG